MTKAEKIQIWTNIATIIGVIASLCFAITSQCTSRDALNISKDLKAEAERVNISFDAKFDDQENIKLVPVDETHREAVLEVYANLTFKNSNPYRAIIIEGIYPTFVHDPKPSELEVKVLKDSNKEPESFSVSSLTTIGRKALISWPIDKELADFVEKLLKDRYSLKVSEFKLELGEHPEVKKSERHRHTILHLRTSPDTQAGKEKTTKLTLY